MAGEYQFLPSSPLAKESKILGKSTGKPNGKSIGKSIGKEKDVDLRARAMYPTPNPSSSLGRSSSPSRAPEDIDLSVAPKKTVKFVQEDKKGGKVRINQDFNVLDPNAKVLRVPLFEDKNLIVIGRSSKRCDFYLKAGDKTISRAHIAIHYSNDHIKLQCLGYNGFGMRIPKLCGVDLDSNDKGNYVLTEAKSSGLSVQALQDSYSSVLPRTVKFDGGHTEFMVNRTETVTMPKFHNILIDIRGNLLLLNPLDVEEELTDDEALAKINAKMANEKPDVAVTVETPTQEHSHKVPNTPKKLKLASSEEEPTPVRKPADKVEGVAQLKPPITPQSFAIFTKEESKLPLATNAFSNDEADNSIRDQTRLISRPTTPLGDISNTFTSPSFPKRRAQSEEPQKPRKKKKARQQTLVIDQSLIKDVPNVSEINHILVNHLAFSRLSSTPASALNQISGTTSKLTLAQLRVILHNIASIGVIYREGTDAAGEPLEEEYYYMPENDDDPQRPLLVANIKGHGGLRSCRRTHKQYYWKKPAPIKR